MAGKRASEGAGGEPLHYGRRHAQTEELYHAHALEKQLEALAAEEGLEETPAPAPPEKPAPAAPPVLGVPIGGLGEAAAPPLEAVPPAKEPPRGVLREAVVETRRRVEAVAAAAAQLAKEAGHLVHLPLEVLRRARHQLLRRPGWI